MLDVLKDFLNRGPIVWVFLFLFVGASLRAHATYAIGRLTRHLVIASDHAPRGWRGSLWRTSHSPSVSKGMDFLRRRGWPAIPLGFLTVGFQSAIMFSAGIVGTSWGFFALAVVPGALMWATIYSTIGWAAWQTVVLAIAANPIALIAGFFALATGAYAIYRKRQITDKILDDSTDITIATPAEELATTHTLTR
ncbi:DedA family protein [Arcanobacterium canis]